MRIGFLIERSNAFKIYGPIIDAAFKRGHEVVLFYNNVPESKVGSKAYQWPSPAECPVFGTGSVQIIQYDSIEELVLLEKTIGPDVFIDFMRNSPHPGAHQFGAPLVVVQHAFDGIFHLLNTDAFMVPRLMLMGSQQWVDLLLKTIVSDYSPDEDMLKNVRSKIIPVGFPEFDQVKLLDRQSIKQQLNIPLNKPVVLYITYGFMWQRSGYWDDLVFAQQSQQAALRQVVTHGKFGLLRSVKDFLNYQQVLDSIRRFCDREGAYLISKSRIKDVPSVYEMTISDFHTFDQSFYPHLTLQLLAVSDLVILSMSTVTMEAIYSHVPVVCMVPPVEISMAGSPFILRSLNGLQFDQPDTFFNYDGLSYQISLLDLTIRLEKASLADFQLDEDRRASYVETFLGWEDGASSERLLDALETHL